MTADFHIPLAAEQRSVAVELQATLVDLLDLTLIGKHAHWNVEGPHFRSVHLELDELVYAWQRLSDDVAERAVTIGASPDGQAETIAGATQFQPLPAGHLSDRRVLEAIGDRLAEAATSTRERIGPRGRSRSGHRRSPHCGRRNVGEAAVDDPRPDRGP